MKKAQMYIVTADDSPYQHEKLQKVDGYIFEATLCGALTQIGLCRSLDEPDHWELIHIDSGLALGITIPKRSLAQDALARRREEIESALTRYSTDIADYVNHLKSIGTNNE